MTDTGYAAPTESTGTAPEAVPMAESPAVAPIAPADSKPYRKIAILGYAPSVRDAPFNDPSFEIWGLNDMLDMMPRVDVLFEMHSEECIKSEGHWDRLAAVTKQPILMQRHFPDIPKSVQYPMDAIAAKYTLSGCDRPYITCTASFMLPIAIEQSPDEIHIFGIDMAQDTEFANQRPSCEFFLGVAVGRGIKVYLQPQSDLLKTPFVYAIEDGARRVMQERFAERRKYLTDQLNLGAQKEQIGKDERLQYMGALADLDFMFKRWVNL